jgi:hypothetical protein
MNRETKIVQTPGGVEVVLNTFITGREEREIEQAMYSNVKMQYAAKAQDINMEGFDAASLVLAENKALELVVVSVGGKTENVIEAILDLSSIDYRFIKDQVNEITGKK